ncbi:MAG: cytidine deaminase [Bacteroidales bacterium]|nr:cytidine deaminase [Bacteroidales bacterium]
MTPEKLIELAKEAMTHAYVPYSGYKVGAALLCADGTVYQGCNIENAAYGPTNCAERTAFFKAVYDGHRDFVSIAVCGGKDGVITGAFPPCGVCRQVMREFCEDDFVIYMVDRDGYEQRTLAEILPFSFSAKTPDKLDYKQMESLVEYVFAMAQVLSDRDGRIRAASSKRTMEEAPDKGEERVYTQEAVDKRATFLHGTEEQFLNRWVYEYLKYPESAIRNGVEGKVVAEFVVDAKGKVRDVEIVKGVDEELDAQVVKVISASPKWKPAQIKGREVSVKISLPVEFRLTKSPTFKIKK